MKKYYLNAVFAVLFLLSLFTFASRADAIVRPIVFPVEASYSFRDDFNDLRAGGTRTHRAIDIIAAKMKRVFAAVDGVVVYVVSPEASWGYSIGIRDADGYQYNYLHLNNDTPGTDDGKGGEANAYAPGIARGVRVTKGQHVGWVGDSGNAENTVSHLHFEMEDPNNARINPYESLLAASVAGAMVEAPGVVVNVEIPEIDLDPQFPNAITRELALDARGAMVRLLQTKLKDLGFYTSAYITEYFDSITRDAVIRFQQAHSLELTGILDYKTRVIFNQGTGFTEPASTASQTTTGDLQEGSRGPAVTELQLKLKSLGYYTSSSITDYFGSITKSAVIRFQTAYGIDPAGIVGPQTRTALANATAAKATLPFISDLQLGSKGTEVDSLQIKLKELGFYTSVYITGVFDSLTYDAVVRFQRARGITPTGAVGTLTRTALNPRSVLPTPAPVPVVALAPLSLSYVFTQNLQEGSRGDAVRQLQFKLKSLGYYTSSTITDYFGAITKAAVIRFQTAKGIDPVGIVGPKTRTALNSL